MAKDLPDGKPILCMDFDGVIHSYESGWKGAHIIPDPPVPGALQFLEKASEHFEVHIFSSRSHQRGGRGAMQHWLCRQVTGKDISECDQQEVPPWLLAIRWPDHKPAAMVMIDDRAICFNGVFPDIKELIHFQPWNKKGKVL